MVRHQEPKWFVHLKYGLLITVMVIGWSVREFHKIAPKAIATTKKITDLNKLETVDLHGSIGGCVPVGLKGNL